MFHILIKMRFLLNNKFSQINEEIIGEYIGSLVIYHLLSTLHRSRFNLYLNGKNK